MPKKPMILTFEEGWLLPRGVAVLQEFGMKAVVLLGGSKLKYRAGIIK